MTNAILLDILKSASRQCGSYAEHRKYSHETVCAVQEALGIGVDGVIGEETVYATMVFQELFGANSVDGYIGPETLRLMHQSFLNNDLPLSSQHKDRFRKKMRSEELRDKQVERTWLATLYNRKREYSVERIKKIQRCVGVDADGMFGGNTTRAIMAWQKQQGLQSDGRVGPSTLLRMGLDVG